jgi:hypothetical protein
LTGSAGNSIYTVRAKKLDENFRELGETGLRGTFFRLSPTVEPDPDNAGVGKFHFKPSLCRAAFFVGFRPLAAGRWLLANDSLLQARSKKPDARSNSCQQMTLKLKR